MWIRDSGYAVVATTRPETIMGDTAMCINPNDPKNQHLRGKKVIVPLVNRVIPVIEDDYVDIEFGTGCLKVTPAHDVNDYMLGEKMCIRDRYICAAMMALGVSSCDSFLTTPPLDQISEDQWWSDKSQTEMMVKGAYQYVYGPNEVVLRDCIRDNATPVSYTHLLPVRV